MKQELGITGWDFQPLLYQEVLTHLPNSNSNIAKKIVCSPYPKMLGGMMKKALLPYISDGVSWIH